MRKTPEPQHVTSGNAVDRSGLIHRVWEPLTPGPHPTMVMLHGRSGNEDVMWIFAKSAPADWLIVAPRAIETDPGGGFSWRLRATDEWPSLNDFDDAVAAVHDFIVALPDLYGADPQATYLMGFSQGAATAYATAMRHPELVQGIAGLAGFMPVECDAVMAMSALRDMPIFMAAGKRDPLIPHSRTVACANTLHAAGADLDFHEYDTGHKLNAQGMRDLRAWWRARATERRT